MQQPFYVWLRGKLVQVKMSLYKLMGLDHFTIEEKYRKKLNFGLGSLYLWAILKTKVNPRTVKIKIFLLVVDP